MNRKRRLLAGGGFRDRGDWMLLGSMLVELKGDMRLAFAAAEYFLIELVLARRIGAMPTD
jgi:hypothetical protein